MPTNITAGLLHITLETTGAYKRRGAIFSGLLVSKHQQGA
jgi:hypothetical protein